jgi:FAD/FMN-containing dehydrogenase|tara:strand:- start:1302 stop:2690 length:1389 start_codon:yes stop_codon:yes gene_type:complete
VLQPSAAYTPESEQEVLEILNRHRGQSIRAVGRLHSWSEAILGDGVQLDLRRLKDVVLESDGDQFVATVGAGCQIKRLLKELNRDGATLPSLGLITVQTIAGAISTGTHGSGRHSMSHYVEEVRLARYDESTGQAFIDELSAGEPLLAARCSLGSLGIILSVKIRCRAQYNVQEHFTESQRLEDVLDAEESYPIQQFYLIPWRWSYFIQHRREYNSKRSRLAKLYRIYWMSVMDYGMHLQILFLERVLRSRRMIRFAFRRIISTFLIRKWKVTDLSSSMLVMNHEAFRHIEIELFVPRDQLTDALRFTQEVIKVAGGNDSALSADNQQRINEIGMQDSLYEIQNQYCHHYPICVRRVLPDDTLISMASGGNQDWYALSFISYAKPARRAGFSLFSRFMALSMSQLFQARPHWGKICPLEASELTSLYPRFDSFRTVCNTLDPKGVFQNEWTKALLEADDHVG